MPTPADLLADPSLQAAARQRLAELRDAHQLLLGDRSKLIEEKVQVSHNHSTHALTKEALLLRLLNVNNNNLESNQVNLACGPYFRRQRELNDSALTDQASGGVCYRTARIRLEGFRATREALTGIDILESQMEQNNNSDTTGTSDPPNLCLDLVSKNLRQLVRRLASLKSEEPDDTADINNSSESEVQGFLAHSQQQLPALLASISRLEGKKKRRNRHLLRLHAREKAATALVQGLGYRDLFPSSNSNSNSSSSLNAEGPGSSDDDLDKNLAIDSVCPELLERAEAAKRRNLELKQKLMGAISNAGSGGSGGVALL